MITVDQDECIECGLCINICPEVFHWNDHGKASGITEDVPDEMMEKCRRAQEGCPTEAISHI